MNLYTCMIYQFPQPENILCETSKSRNIKMIDFGLAARLDPEQTVKVFSNEHCVYHIENRI